MIGAIIGDIIGSRFEFSDEPPGDFDLFTDECSFTDDTVATIATMDWMNNGGKAEQYAEVLSKWVRKYKNVGFGGEFLSWALSSDRKPYGSYGNGAAMRVSPAAWVSTTEGGVDILSEKIAKVSHNHKDAINGAKAIANCTLMARLGYSKSDMRSFVKSKFGYDLDGSLNDYSQIGNKPSLFSAARVTVPAAIASFLLSGSFEGTLKNAVSLGGDTDTIASMAASIADAYYGIPPEIEKRALEFLPDSFKRVVDEFSETAGKFWKDYISYYTQMPEIIESRKSRRD